MLDKKTVSADLQAKKTALEATFAHIDKQYGKGSIMFLGDTHSMEVDAITTGSILIDQAIGIPGFPRGRVIEVYGPEASGKTTLALQVVAQAQKAGGICAFIDAEHALDVNYAKKLGIDVQSLIVSQPDYGEQALEIAEALIRSGSLDVIVIDSVAALVPKAEVDGDMGDAHMGLQARLMSQALRKLTPVVHKSKTILIFINQVRQTMNAMAFAPKETTTGGKALKFYASLRLDVRRIEGIKDKDGSQKGNVVKVKIAKNKMAPPFKEVTVRLIFGEGICPFEDLLEAALIAKIIKQSGAWFSYHDEKIGQGREAVLQKLKAESEFFALIKKQVKQNPTELVGLTTEEFDQEQ